jgi:hypothetical protein
MIKAILYLKEVGVSNMISKRGYPKQNDQNPTGNRGNQLTIERGVGRVQKAKSGHLLIL